MFENRPPKSARALPNLAESGANVAKWSRVGPDLARVFKILADSGGGFANMNRKLFVGALFEEFLSILVEFVQGPAWR